ncbi:thiamine-phosphate pyrophosphorylase [Janibacter sp. Soil728]|uniref:thiamine phosphate synthase n=1 Tax=Janibacter sp. Soil728 TaxID=1736393 RepID=UPI0006F3746C|nr:thiamine phosphate synthase [Janibacter sp. Soil728]KRE35766.1 thiamine-phosphate pyrophosphorylase [Janibacter sp. Soil728]
MGLIDWRLYLVTSGDGPSTVAAAASAAAAGAGVVQVRAKHLLAGDLLDLVLAVAVAVEHAAPTTRVLVNDRADVAHAARRRGAPVHGVHLGQADLPVAEARALLGPDALVGLTAGTLDHVREAHARTGPGRPDYLGSGPFRPTPTKDVGRPPVGLAGYPLRAAATDLPVIAIGDITPADIPLLSTTGIAGVAVVRAVMGARDPEVAAAACLRRWG